MQNDGNFRAMLCLRLQPGDEALQDHLTSCKLHASLVRKTIQNEPIVFAGDLVKNDIIEDVKKAAFWTIKADKTQDCAKRAQLVIAIRYVNTKDKAVNKEEPLVILDLIADIDGNDKSNTKEYNEVKLRWKAMGEIFLYQINVLGLDLQFLGDPL